VRTEDLIVDLARRAEPVTPLPPTWVRWSRWAAVSVGVVALAVIVKGPRSNLTEAIQSAAFGGSTLVLFATAGLAGAIALASSVPGSLNVRGAAGVPVGLALLWPILLLVSLISHGDMAAQFLAEPREFACVLSVMLLGLLPSLAMVVMVRRAAPLEFFWTGAWALLAGLALGAIGAQFICPIDRAAHLLLWHVTPVALLTVAGAIAGRVLLSKSFTMKH
jgi:hypothetical protein